MKKQAIKKLSAILAVAMVIMAIAPLSVFAADTEFEAGNLKYEIMGQSGVTIRGFASNVNVATTVSVPATVTNAATGQIYDVTEVGDRAFYDEDNVSGVDFSQASNLTRIGDEAFGRANIVGGVNLSNLKKLTYIGNYAFAYLITGSSNRTFNLSGLTALRSIGIEAFAECSVMASTVFNPLELPNLVEIGSKAFYGANISNSVLDFSKCTKLTRIGGENFRNNNNLTKVIFPASLNFLGDRCFMDDPSLSEIYFTGATPPTLDQPRGADDAVFGNISPNGTLHYPQGATGYTSDYFKVGSVDPFGGWALKETVPDRPGVVITPVNESAEVPEAEIPGFGRDFSVSGEVTNAPGVPESVKLRVSSPSPEFTSNKAANAAYSDALLYGQPVAFSGLDIADAVSGQVFALPEGAVVRLAFELGAAYADQGVTISQYDVNGALIERFNVTCDGNGAVVINANGLGLFVITQEWI